MDPIRTVVFDLGGVLINWNPAQILADFYADPALRRVVQQAVFDHADWKALDRGTLEDQQALERFGQRTGRPLAEMAALMQAMRESLMPVPESWALARELCARKIPLYALSNVGTSSWQHLATRYDVWHVFSGGGDLGGGQAAKAGAGDL